MKTLAKTLRALTIAAALGLPLAARAQPAATPPAPLDPAAHAFDFEFGAWKAHLSRRLKPLTGSNTWVEYTGTSTVTPWWRGKANVGELELQGPTGHIEGMSVRVYNPATHQWGISFANSAQGQLGSAMFGGFKDGRGEFYAQDTLNDRMILVRFIFSGVSDLRSPATDREFQLEQAFSDDGGKTWEPNWIAKFTR
jgi:hypothetical protein